jgi:predicted metal-dependent RNase
MALTTVKTDTIAAASRNEEGLSLHLAVINKTMTGVITAAIQRITELARTVRLALFIFQPHIYGNMVDCDHKRHLMHRDGFG